MISFNSFLRWEKTTKDTIDFKKIYVDMADGDPIAGLALSQIVFWHLPDRNGKNKMRVFREGYWWIAKPREDWWEECRLTPKRVDRALKILRDDAGIVVTKNFKFGPQGSPTLHVRIDEEAFIRAWETHLGPDILLDPDPIPLHPDRDDDDEKTEGKLEFPKRVKRELPSVASFTNSAILNFPEREVSFLPNVNLDFPKKAISGTETILQRPVQRPTTSHREENFVSESEIVDVVDFSESKKTARPERLQKLEAIIAQRIFDIGVRPRRLCEQFAHENRRLARRQLKFWAYRRENDVQYLLDHQTSAGAIFRRCLDEDRAAPPAWEVAQQDRHARLRPRHDEARRAIAREIEQQQREEREFEAKVFVSRTMGEFERLTPQKQAQVLAEIKTRNEFLNERSGGNLRRVLESDSPLRAALIESIAAVLQEWKQRQPEFPALRQRAAGESFDDSSAGESFDALEAEPVAALPPKPHETEGFGTAASSPTLARLMAQRGAPKAPAVVPQLSEDLGRAVASHFAKIHFANTYTIDEIDKYRNDDFSDDEWAQVLAEVARMLKEWQRLAA